MTREEEIKINASKYIENNSIDGYVQADHEDSFITGAQWADSHPKSPWISVKDDLPCNHKELIHSNYTDRVLVLSRHGYSDATFMSIIEDVWEWETPIKVLYWMPIPDLPKE